MARDEAREAEVTELAERTLRDHGARALPVDPMAIAAAKDVAVRAVALPENTFGLIMLCDGQFVIGYSDRLENVGRKQFTIAHELGHYFIDDHALALLKPGTRIHSCESGSSNNPYEKEADLFASALLMPARWFSETAASMPAGLKAVLELSELCQTSITATANRYAILSPGLCLSIISDGPVVRYGFLSASARSLFTDGSSCFFKKRPVPPDGVTGQYDIEMKKNARQEEPADPPDGASDQRAARLKGIRLYIPKTEGSCFLSDWLPAGPRIEMREEVRILGDYGKFTILTGIS